MSDRAQTNKQKAEARAALDHALALIFKAWSAGWWFSMERAHPALQPSPFVSRALHHPAAREALGREAAACAGVLSDLLAANKKDWAERRDEFAMAPVFKPNARPQFGLVLLEKRRAIGPGLLIEDPRQLPERFRHCNGIILPTGMRHKEEIAWWLHEAGMLRSDVFMIEVPDAPGEDYRDVISGSHWLRSDVRPKDDDAVGRALLTAMQARSFRKDAIKAGRTGWWQGLAAARFARAHAMSAAEACSRLGFAAPEIVKWAERAMSWKGRPAADAAPDHGVETATAPASSQPLPATDKQKGVATSLVAELPMLARFFPADWDKDRRSASSAIGRALTAAERIRAARESCEREIAAALAAAAN